LKFVDLKQRLGKRRRAVNRKVALRYFGLAEVFAVLLCDRVVAEADPQGLAPEKLARIHELAGFRRASLQK